MNHVIIKKTNEGSEKMEFVHQTIGSSALDGIIEIPPKLRDREVQIIILPIESNMAKELKQEDMRGYKLNMGFLPGPEIPDSFFEPLPEEDLQAWGL
jgi:hypothetical protein